MVPTLSAEQALWDRGYRRIAGVDEVGVGCLAGPVVAAAVLLPPECALLAGVRDSKTLSPAQRERLARQICQLALSIGIGAASVAEIERFNIRRAAHLAMRRALARLGQYDHALVDGRRLDCLDPARHTAIVDGDATSFAIACASIIAKVTRDRAMRLLARRYPGYGWEHNVGYGTREHLAALRSRGITPFHRRGYEPVRAALASAS